MVVIKLKANDQTSKYIIIIFKIKFLDSNLFIFCLCNGGGAVIRSNIKMLVKIAQRKIDNYIEHVYFWQGKDRSVLI